MAERGFVIDTSVIVDYRNEHLAALEFLVPLVEKRAASIHPVVAGEMLEGVFDR